MNATTEAMVINISQCHNGAKIIMDKLQNNLLHAFISVLTLLSMAACDRSSSGIDYSGRYWETEAWKKELEKIEKQDQEHRKATWNAAEKLRHGMICKLDRQSVAVTKEGRHIIITPANNPAKVTTIPITTPYRYKEKEYQSKVEEGPTYRTCRPLSRKELNTLKIRAGGFSEFEKEFLKGYIRASGWSVNEDDCLYYDLSDERLTNSNSPGLDIARIEGKFRSSLGMSEAYETYLKYQLTFNFTEKKVIGMLTVMGINQSAEEVMNFNYVTYERSPAWLAKHRFFNFKGRNIS